MKRQKKYINARRSGPMKFLFRINNGISLIKLYYLNIIKTSVDHTDCFFMFSQNFNALIYLFFYFFKTEKANKNEL